MHIFLVIFLLLPFITFFVPFIYRAIFHKPQDLKVCASSTCRTEGGRR
jgi:hypothetical protein